MKTKEEIKDKLLELYKEQELFYIFKKETEIKTLKWVLNLK